MIDERIEEQAAAYAIGALGADEAQAFELVLRDDPQMRELVAELRDAAADFAGQSPGVVPSELVKARILRELDRTAPAGATNAPPVARRAFRTALPWAIAAGFAVACALLGWQMGVDRRELVAQRARADGLRMTMQMLRIEDADLRQTVQRLQESNRLAGIRIALLTSQLASAPKAIAVSLWDNQHQTGVFMAQGMKPAPTGKDYQLWIIDPKYPAPVDAGVFHVAPDGEVREDYKARQPIESAVQFAVTEEVAGGAPAPTLKAMVLAGS